MAKARKTKLKVFRTPIGFHDAYVAAPSQKAALEAWGSDSNLFAAGAAEQVSEPELMDVPLARPGEVIKVLRGSKAEQVAALGKARSRKGGSPAKSGTNDRGPKPSTAAVDAAEAEVDALKRAQANELAEIDKEVAAIERRRRDLARRQRRALAEAEDKAERERSTYERALRAWKNSG